MYINKFFPTSLANLLLEGTRHQRKFVLQAIDSTIFVFSLYLAIAIRFEFSFPGDFLARSAWQILILIPIQLLVFRASGIYRSVLRYSSLTLIQDASRAVALSTGLLITLTYFLGDWALSRSIFIINALLTLILVISVRLIIRSLVQRSVSHRKRSCVSDHKVKRLIIYGAGSAGVELLHALSFNPDYDVVGFADDNSDFHKKANVEGVTIYSPSQLSRLWKDHYFDSVVLAMPSVPRVIRKRIVEQLSHKGITVQTVPSLASIISGQVTIKKLRDVDITDLLGRDEVSPNMALLKRQITHKAVLVTGAGGSIGSEICRQIVQQQPRCLVLYERNELALYQIHRELADQYPSIQLIPCLGSVTDKAYLCTVLSQHSVKTVYHAAAYKHVPLLECNISKGIENNVLGTLVAAQSAIDSSVDQFVLISTDKAVRPTNVMGTTKRIAELTIQALSDYHAGPLVHQQSNQRSGQNTDPYSGEHSRHQNSVTRFAIVRFGNVLGSSGSVVPRFRKQIAAGGPITLTHPDITRYFMSIPEAARLVIQAGAMSKGGEVFLLDMGEPVKIYDLAAQMIRLSGFVPEQDIAIQVTGLRPGEKLYEELLISGDNISATYHSKIYSSRENFIPWKQLSPQLNLLIERARANQNETVKSMLKALVPEYTPDNAAKQPPSQPQSPQPQSLERQPASAVPTYAPQSLNHRKVVAKVRKLKV